MNRKNENPKSPPSKTEGEAPTPKIGRIFISGPPGRGVWMGEVHRFTGSVTTNGDVGNDDQGSG